MKPLPSLLLSGLTCHISFVAASSAVARVYLHDPDSVPEPTSKQPSLPADTARLIIAQRLGLSSFHALQEVDEEDLEYINRYAAPEQTLFVNPSSSRRPQAIVVVEEGEWPEDIDPSLISLPSFDISNPPSPSSNAALLQDLVEQASSAEYGLAPSSNLAHHLEHDESYKSLPASDRYFLHRQSSDNIGQLLSTLRSKSATLTLIFMPTSNSSNDNSWGSYSLPTEFTESYIRSPHAYAHAHAHAKRQGEELLEAETQDSKSGENIETVSVAASSSASSSGSTSAPTSTTPPAGILPACFPNADACSGKTNGCSGHGTCELKYTNKDQQGSQKECWACKCQNIVDKNDMGQLLTTVWGGPACQKRDVSTSFWLLAGFTIAMVSAVAWGIGLLLSMGSEELPSVIGAGVSGPGARGK
ncbi:hypothetical protein EV356DRAFT_501646 [Viridothelium virens]|uniref:Uncharacterized protein n=1 Tax=Viridothelium virens TaxID=1048519 RepID=A0A6A6H8M1_VIRVR|nr:hypothetical protein EV356DRAFT_501646 [Viridothelium virens]